MQMSRKGGERDVAQDPPGFLGEMSFDRPKQDLEMEPMESRDGINFVKE